MAFEFSELQDCRCFLLRRAARAVTQRYERALSAGNLKAGQFSLLSILRMCGEMTVTQLAKQAGLDRTTLTRNLQPLERDGLVETYHGADRRERLIRITDEGRRRHALPLKAWKREQDILKEQLGDSDWEELSRILRKIAD